MAIRDIGQAVNALAEKLDNIEKRITQIANQRRLQVVDIFGQEFSRTGYFDASTNRRNAVFYISVSPDLVYLERFQFKIHLIHAENDTHWHIYYVDDETREKYDLTPYFMEQVERMQEMGIDNAKWLDGSDRLYPVPYFNKVGEENPNKDNVLPAFDLIDVSNVMHHTGEKELADKLTEGGLKRFEIEVEESESGFDVALYLYLKYSHLNR